MPTIVPRPARHLCPEPQAPPMSSLHRSAQTPRTLASRLPLRLGQSLPIIPVFGLPGAPIKPDSAAGSTCRIGDHDHVNRVVCPGGETHATPDGRLADSVGRLLGLVERRLLLARLCLALRLVVRAQSCARRRQSVRTAGQLPRPSCCPERGGMPHSVLGAPNRTAALIQTGCSSRTGAPGRQQPTQPKSPGPAMCTRSAVGQSRAGGWPWADGPVAGPPRFHPVPTRPVFGPVSAPQVVPVVAPDDGRAAAPRSRGSASARAPPLRRTRAPAAEVRHATVQMDSGFGRPTPN